MISHVSIHLDLILTSPLLCPMLYVMVQRDVYRTVVEDLDLMLTVAVRTIMMLDLCVLMQVSVLHSVICLSINLAS